MVNNDNMKGTINEIAGRARRQVGEWTGDQDAQLDGLAQEIKGKAQKVWGGVKDSVRNAIAETEREGENYEPQSPDHEAQVPERDR